MQINKEQFRSNLLSAIVEAKIEIDILNAKFTIVPVQEENVRYNTLDDYLKRWMFNEKNLQDRFFDLNEAIDFLVQPNQKFPLWIEILHNGNSTFELLVSMRFRTPTQLKYIESGHPPFIYKGG